jgi:beta-xylosidase
MYCSDNGNGTFSNPLIWGDYPDPDIIRVGVDFYLVSSSFTCAPGIPICHSMDLVNWRIIGHAYDRLPDSNPAYVMKDGATAYRGGSWAPFIRHRAGRFYIGFCTPAEGFFMCIADHPEGPYERIAFGVELYDPSLLFDDDGRVFVFHGANGIYVTELEADARSVKTQPQPIFQTPFGTPLEGSHIYKRNGWYYLCLTCRGYNGLQVILRSRAITGPYDWRIICADDLNYAGAGLHQGGFVELDTGDTWFFLFQDRDYLGRLPVLLPVRWEEDWPRLGDDQNYGKVAVTLRKPSLSSARACVPEGSDEFDEPTLHKAWHWNHNPDDTRWSLNEHPGWIRLKAPNAVDFLSARNTLMQKIIGPASQAETKVMIAGMKPGDIAGLAVVNIPYAYIGVEWGECPTIVLVHNGVRTVEFQISPVPEIDFRLVVDADGLAHFAYRTQDMPYVNLGEGFIMEFTPKTFLGNRIGLFCYHFDREGEGGYADFDYLRFPPLRPARRFCAYEPIPAVAYDDERGTDTQRLQEKRPAQHLVNLNDGDWVRFDQIDFGAGAEQFQVCACPIRDGGFIEIRLGSVTGKPIGTCEIPPNGNVLEWSRDFFEYTCTVAPVCGIQSICLRFRGGPGSLFKLESFKFWRRFSTIQEGSGQGP